MRIFESNVKAMTAIVVHPTPEYTTKSSEFEHLPPTPIRGILLGPSAAGKTTVLIDLILRIYRGCWERIYVFSPSVDVDMAWKPVKEYVERTLGVDPSKEKCFFNTWDTQALSDIVETQRKVTEHSKKAKMKKLYGILVICDDFADQPAVMHASSGGDSGGSMLNTLFIRGRHMMISTLCRARNCV